MSMDRMMDVVRKWGRPWTGGSEPLEIHRAILEDVEAQVVAVGGGRRIFPFDRVEVTLLALSPTDKTRLEAIAQSGWDLGKEMDERLRAGGARVPEGLAVEVRVTEERLAEFAERRYALAFRREAPAAADADADPQAGRPAAGTSADRPALRLTVLRGKAARDAYDLAGDRVYLGRLEEVLDAAGRVKRRNDVAFLDEGAESDVGHTVSREHARIAWDPQSRDYWLRDEGSASGTLLLRHGRSIEVSRHDRRGVRLESGDEVYLGRAAVKVEIGGGSV